MNHNSQIRTEILRSSTKTLHTNLYVSPILSTKVLCAPHKLLLFIIFVKVLFNSSQIVYNKAVIIDIFISQNNIYGYKNNKVNI